MSAVVLPFPDRRGNRPAPMNPVSDVVSKVRMYCYKVGCNDVQRATVLRGIEHWQQCGLDDATITARAMAMANRLALGNHDPDPTSPRAA